MRKFIFVSLISIFSCKICFAEESTYDLLLKGKKCSEGLNQRIECNYKIGNDFWLAIAGVGTQDAGVTFIESSFSGNYYGTFGIGHGCVIVKTGKKAIKKNPFDFAFVSPENGKVYKDWPSCKSND